MMLKYQDKNKIRKNKKSITGIIVLVLFFLVTALGAWSFIRGPINFVSRPFLMIGDWFSRGFNNIEFYFDSKKELSNQNVLLNEENLSLKAKLEDYSILENENEELKNILNRTKKINNYVLANILTKPNRSLYDSVILDIGKKDSLEIGDMAYAYGEIPVGKISEVYENSSLLTFFSSPGLKTEGFINEVNAAIELVGRGGGNFEAIIPVELNLEKDTIIYFPEYTSQVLAKIVETISNPSDPFKKVILVSPVSLESLKWVQVKTN